MIFFAVTGPMPGSESSWSAVAVLRWTGPVAGAPEVATPAGAAPRRGTTTCSPSASGAATFTSSSCALRVGPPARATASAIRAPRGSRYSPGRRTAPTTSTYMSAPLPPAAEAVDVPVGIGGAATACDRCSSLLPRETTPRTTTAATTICSRVRRKLRTTKRVSPAKTHACVTDSCRLRSSAHDEIHEPARHDDRLPDLPAVEMHLHLRRCLGAGYQFVLRQVRRHMHAIADLAVDLDDELERLVDEHRGIGLRPRRLPKPFVAEPSPELFRDVRRVRLDQGDGCLGREAGVGSDRVARQLIDQLHDCRDRRVELEAPFDVIGDLRDRLVCFPRQRRVAWILRRSLLGHFVDDTPQSAQKAHDPFHPGVRPLHVLIRRAHEQDVQTDGVGAVLVYERIRPCDVAA